MPSFGPRPTDLHRLLESVLGLYGETHPTIVLRADFAGDLPTLDADGDQLKRAVLNLVDNAVEAGATEVVDRDALDEGEHVQVVIADNGPGIPADLRDRVFLPYFSTKTTGMGLGLPIVHQIVSDHGGRIEVEDNAARDPLHDRAAGAPRERPGGPHARAGRRRGAAPSGSA